MRLFLAAVIALAPVLASAQDTAGAPPPPPTRTKPEVYKWIDSKGTVHYTDKPPTENAVPAKLPPLQTYKGGRPPALPQLDPKAPAKATAADAPQLELVSPAAGETFRDGEASVSVVVTVTPALTPSYRLVYHLDGQTSGPTMAPVYVFEDVERGEHQVSVSLVTTDGAEVSSTAPVPVFMKPPTVRPKKPAPPKP